MKFPVAYIFFYHKWTWLILSLVYVHAAVTGAAQAFNEEMTVDDLYSWLLRNKMPPEDCQLFKGEDRYSEVPLIRPPPD